MPVPKYIQQLRARIGHDLILAPGVTALVFDDTGKILLHRNSDFGQWATIGGMLEPGEAPADAVVREVFEETGVRCDPERVSGIYTTPVVTYPNGDQVQYVITAFRCRAIDGAPRVNDEESLEVRYFAANDLPGMRPDFLVRIGHAVVDLPGARFFHEGEWR